MDDGQIAQQVQNEFGTEGITEERLKEQANKNYAYLKQKYGEWEIYGKESSIIKVRIVDYRNALFGGITQAYLILTIVFFTSAIVFGKIVFPQLSKTCLSANKQMADLAAIQTSEIVKEKKNKGEWF